LDPIDAVTFDQTDSCDLSTQSLAEPCEKISELQFTLESEQLLKSSILMNLNKSYEDRINAHENARQLAAELAVIGKELRGEP